MLLGLIFYYHAFQRPLRLPTIGIARNGVLPPKNKAAHTDCDYSLF